MYTFFQGREKGFHVDRSTRVDGRSDRYPVGAGAAVR